MGVVRLERLLPHRVPITVPIQNLQAVPLFPPKNKPGAGLRIPLEMLAHQRGEHVETLTHIRRIQTEINLGSGCIQHGRVSRDCGSSAAKRDDRDAISHADRGLSGILCQAGTAEVVVGQGSVLGMRSSKRMAKWLRASFHLGIGIVHFFEAS